MEGLVKLDRIDISILVELQKDGRMTNVSLADAVGLAAGWALAWHPRRLLPLLARRSQPMAKAAEPR